MRKMNVKKVTAVIVLLVVMILSMTVVSKVASDPENHKKTIESLDEKKEDVLKLTATSAAASTALAAIPGDATTPVANKLADLTSYFLIILMVVFLGKISGHSDRLCRIYHFDSDCMRIACCRNLCK